MFHKIKKTAPNRYEKINVITLLDEMEQPISWRLIGRIALLFGLSLSAVLISLFTIIAVVRLALSF